MASAAVPDIWTINIMKLLLYNGGTLPVAGVVKWAQEQCKQNKQKMPSISTKIKDGLGTYFSVSDANISESYVCVLTPLKLCEQYWSTAGCRDDSCRKIHICKFFLSNHCRNKKCKFFHSFREPCNLSAIHQHGLGFLSEEELRCVWRQQVSIPEICKFYNNERGCNPPQDKPCTRLHVCRFYLKGQCKFDPCNRSHDVSDAQPWGILKRRGWNMERSPQDIDRDLRRLYSEDDDTLKHPNDSAQRSSRQQSRSSTSSYSALIEPMNRRRPDSGVRQKSGVRPDSGVRQKSGVRPDSGVRQKSGVRPDSPVRHMSGVRPDSSVRQKSREKPDEEEAVNGEVRICTFHLKSKCSYGKDCRKLHYNKPFLWQYLERCKGQDRWQSFSEGDNQSIELCFVDVNESKCHACLGTQSDQIVAEIDFDKMEYNSSGHLSGKVRRVGTYSWAEEPITKPFVTRWMWYWKDENGEWNMYGGQEGQKVTSNITSREIEEKFAEQEEVEFQAGIHKYQINFTDMHQINQKYGTKRPIRRRPQPVTMNDSKKPVSPSSESTGIKSPDIKFPPTWNMSAISDHEEYQLVDVPQTGVHKKEWDDIQELVHQSLPTVRVKKISRIQNYELWEDYMRKKFKMEKSRKAIPLKEMRLFHGTRTAIIDPICQQGFDWRLAGSAVGTLHGKGSYFSRSAKYCMDYTDCGKLFVVAVLVGEYTKGSASYTRPPPKDPTKPHKDLYDSCVDKSQDPNIFVIFEKSQSYPEYIIEL